MTPAQGIIYALNRVIRMFHAMLLNPYPHVDYPGDVFGDVNETNNDGVFG